MEKIRSACLSRWIIGLLILAGCVGIPSSQIANSQTTPAPAAPLAQMLKGPLPLTPVGSADPLIAAYDALQLSQGRLRAEKFPEYNPTPFDPNYLMVSTYYDLPLALYIIAARTGDPYWLERAREIAKAWRDSVNSFALERLLLYEDYSVGPMVPPPRHFSTLGLAILAAESNDARAREIVRYHALWVKRGLTYGTGTPATRLFMGDQREAGYSLMALVAAVAIGEDFRAEAKSLLDDILAKQKPEGYWEGWSDGYVTDASGRSIPFVLNYMQGLLLEGLALYDRVIGDPRILPAVQRAVDWTWRTQWVPSASAFQYANITAGTVYTRPEFNLSGLLLPAWGYLFAKTGDPAYRAQGDQILSGMLQPGADGTYGIYGEKQFAQQFRSSSRYLGYLAEH